jgi:hypothetical protein
MSALKILLCFLVRDSVKVDGPMAPRFHSGRSFERVIPTEPVVAQQAAEFLLAAAKSRRSPKPDAGGV